MSGKEQVLEAVAKMPDESTYDEVVERLHLMGALREAEEQSVRGEVVPHEQVKREWRQWISK